MVRLVALGLVLTSCSMPGRSHKDAPVADSTGAALDGPGEAWVPPAPMHDAGPPPVVPCMDAGTCELPPSSCLDASYLVYYTDGVCADDSCSFTTNLLYCGGGCVDGGCQGGFT